MPGAIRQPLVEFIDVDVEFRVCSKPNRFAVDFQLFAAERAMQDREGAAQRGTRAGLIVLAPEQRGERVVAVALPREGEIGEERERFARIDLDRRAIAFEARRTEEEEERSRERGFSHAGQYT